MASPEELARHNIDALLTQCSWKVQKRSEINLSAGRGIAITEGLLKGGNEADYLLFVGGKAIGTVEAKPEGFTLTGVEEQSGKYGKRLLDIYPKFRKPLPFAYESTGVETQFTNQLDPSPKSRNVFAFHKPETLLEWVQSETQLNTRLANLPASDEMPKSNLWSAQRMRRLSICESALLGLLPNISTRQVRLSLLASPSEKNRRPTVLRCWNLIQAQLFFSEFFWGIFDRKPAAEKPWSAGRDRTYQQAHFETLKAETLRY